MTPKEVLIAGRELLADPKNWTQRTIARNKNGSAVSDPWSTEAVCFCSVGAIHKVVGRGELDLKYKVRNLLRQGTGQDESPEFFNDQHTHAEVLDMWDKAIKLADHE